jgi:DNA-binding HxlR family transcriptional regulator
MKAAFSNWPCSVARVMDVFGDAWTPLILRDAVQGITRFDEFQQSLGVARNTLSDRLNKLVDSGVLVKRLYQDNPPRNEYLLTEMGRDFFTVLVAIRNFGDRWLDGGEGAPVTLHHLACGHDLGSRSICASCGEDVVLDDIEFRVGPGYPDTFEPGRDLRPRLAPASKRSEAPLKLPAASKNLSGRTRRTRAKAAS